MERIKTRRGVFINLDDSNIIVKVDDLIFKFSSEKKKQIFLKRVAESMQSVLKYEDKIFKVVNDQRVYGVVREFRHNIYKNVYKNMLYK